MLSLGRQELSAMSKNDVIKHVLALQAEKEATEKIFPWILAAMTKQDLVDRAIILQSEIEWQRVRDMTSGGAG
jgi:hypothetical protein